MTSPARSFSDSLSAYHDKIWRHVAKQLRHMRKYDGEETVHKARVAVKKLIALYELMNYDNRELKPLLKIYKLLGKLRDHTNALSLCLEFKIDSAILDCDRHKMKKICKEVKAKISGQENEWKYIRKHSSKHLHHIDIAKWEKYLKKRLSDIDISLQASPTREQLHDTRKLIKNVLYNNEINTEGSGAGLSSESVVRLKKQEEQISEWHDLFMFKTKLLTIKYNLENKLVYTAVKRKEQRLRKKITAH